MEDLDNNQCQPNNTNQEALLGNKRATIEEAIPNGEATKKHHLSVYSDEERKWLVKAADKERSNGKGFMQRLKERWDAKFPEKNDVSKQNLRDNAARFKREDQSGKDSRTEDGIQTSETVSAQRPTCRKWTNEMKLDVLEIYQRERAQGRGYMKRMKEAWDTIYANIPMTAQTLRDNAARFQKDETC